MIVTGFIHLIGHFVPPQVDTKDKQKLLELMSDLQFQLDPWYSRSVSNLFDCFSLFLTVTLLTLGLNNLIVAKHKMELSTVKSMSLVCFVGMASAMILSLVYAFSIPIILFAICSALMMMSYMKA